MADETSAERQAELKAEIERIQAAIKSGDVFSNLDDARRLPGLISEYEELAKQNGEEQTGALSDLGEDTEAANARRDEYVEDLRGELGEFESSAAYADTDDSVAQAEYFAALDEYGDPLSASEYVGDIDSVAAGAQADERGIDAQLDALERFKDLSTPTMTAEEKFMQEQARVAEERDRRAVMDAALRDLEARGMRSGGAEIAALTGAQDTTSQNRLLGDLGAQANAQKRAMLALQGYGDTAGKIRDSSFNEDFMRGEAKDKVSMFNNKMMSDYNVWKDDFTARERDAALDREKSRLDTGRETTDRRFGRQGLLYNEKEDAAQLGIGTEGMKLDDNQSYTELLLGKESADRAEAMLKEDEEDLFGKAINSNALTSWIDDAWEEFDL